MATLTFYHYELQWLIQSEGYEDENGDYIEGGKEWSEGIKCDISHADGNATITRYEDGTTIGYSHIIHLKRNAPNFYVGQHIRVVKNGMIVVETDVKGFMRYQLKCKIWV